MSKPLTLDQLTTAIGASEKRIGEKIDGLEVRLSKKISDATEPHFTALKTDLEKISDRLDRIEKLLWQGHRLDEIERRVIRLAELAGDASLATPFTEPLGT